MSVRDADFRAPFPGTHRVSRRRAIVIDREPTDQGVIERERAAYFETLSIRHAKRTGLSLARAREHVRRIAFFSDRGPGIGRDSTAVRFG